MSNTTDNTEPRPGMLLSTDAAERKNTPLATGFLQYFPDALDRVTAQARKLSLNHTAKFLEWVIVAKLSYCSPHPPLKADRLSYLTTIAAASIALSELVLAGRAEQDRGQARVCTNLFELLRAYPLTCSAVARVSKAGNDQHNPGQPLHWERSKSTDHEDCIARHLVDVRELDTDGQPHAAKLVWRALAALQIELERDQAKGAP
jgi:hypothetical protein